VKALERDPASCDALWGAGRLGIEAASKSRDEASLRARDTALGRLEGYLRLCPRGAEVEVARRIVDARR